MATRTRGKKVKVGFRPDINVAMRGEAEIIGPRKAKTPLQRVREELSKAFDTFGNYKPIGEKNQGDNKQRKPLFEVTDILKREFIGEALLIDTITSMHMLTLAGVFLYLQKHPEPTPDEFTDEELDLYLRVLMSNFLTPTRGVATPSQEEQGEVRYRYKQTFLRYILKVLALRAEGITPQVIETLDEPIIAIGGGQREEGDEEE